MDPYPAAESDGGDPLQFLSIATARAFSGCRSDSHWNGASCAGNQLSNNVEMLLLSGEERFTADDMYELSGLVSLAWTDAADRDWSVQAGTVEWSCTRTDDYAVDCAYAVAAE